MMARKKKQKHDEVFDVVGLDMSKMCVEVPSSVAGQFFKSCLLKGISTEERLQFLVYADALGLINEEKIKNIVEKFMESKLGLKSSANDISPISIEC
jgi:hypothetical protein